MDNTVRLQDTTTPGWLERCYGDFSYYDDRGDDPSRGSEHSSNAIALIRPVTAANPRVFEIGFGTGGFLDWAAAQGYETSGVEIIPSLVKRADERGHTVRTGTIFDFPASPATLDLIVAFHVIEHLTQQEILDTLDEGYRRLKPGGQFLIEVPNAGTPFAQHIVHGSTHLSYLTVGALKQFGRVAGFEPHYAGNAPRMMSGTRSKIAKRLAYLVRDLVEYGFAALYNGGKKIPLDPCITVVLRKPG